MQALRVEDGLVLRDGLPVPDARDESLVQVLLAGICNTDLEIIKGYAGFRGTPGHEFVGRVVDSPEAAMIGKRVVGEINAGCGECDLCRGGDARHCPGRTVLGIKGRDGAFAEYLSLPAGNLIEVPDSISDQEAVFAEPLAAALHVLDEIEVRGHPSIALVGDGKLGQLVARSLATAGLRFTMLGKHESKLCLAPAGTETVALQGSECAEETADFFGSSGSNRPSEPRPSIDSRIAIPEALAGRRFDLLIEASGSPLGLNLALNLVRPRGTVILKSTHRGAAPMDTSLVVVNEITLRGSRCGRLARAIDLLASKTIDLKPLITACFPLEDWHSAFKLAAQPESMKVMLRPGAL